MEAKDGEQALALWRTHAFDVVITDCNMLYLSGYELTGAIRDEERAQGVPPTLILGFTANAQPEEKVRCLEAGMDDCLFKPIRLADLDGWLAERFVETTSARPPASQIDLSGLEPYVGGDRTQIDRLLRKLAESNREDRESLLHAQANDNLPALKDLAHRIKGGARIVGARHLIECCEQLERACSLASAALIDEAVDQLQHAMQRLDQSLEQG
jgi:two-component system sensor histidine kinase EvgS